MTKVSSSAQSSLRGGNETILIAEDEETLRALARDVLEGLGYTVLLANNGEQAIKVFVENVNRMEILGRKVREVLDDR